MQRRGGAGAAWRRRHSTGGRFAGEGCDFTDAEKGLCVGIGDERSGGEESRLAIRCGTAEDEKYLGATATKSSAGDSVTIEWDDGGLDALGWAGE